MSNITTTTTTGFAPQMQEYGLAAAKNVMGLGQQAYQPYSYNINAFSAPVSGLQVAGQQTINNAAGMAQPYIANATSILGNYLGAGTATLGQAYNTIGNAQNTGAVYNQAGMAGYQGAVQTGAAYNQAAAQGYAGAPAAASGYNNMAGQGYVGAYNTAAPYTQTATAGYAAAPGTSAPYNAAAGQGYLGASQAAAPLNQAAVQGYGAAPGASAEQNKAAQAGYYGAANAANPYNQTAGQAYAAAPGMSAAQNAAAQEAYANAPGSVSQYNQSALQGYGNSLTASAPLNQAAIQGYGAAPSSSATQNAAAQAGYTGAASAANPYNQTASQGYAAAPGMSASQNAAAQAGYNNAATAANAYNQAATAGYTAAPGASAAQNAAAQAAYANAPGSVSQYNQSALQGFNNSVSAATPLNQAAIKGYTDATGAANPYNLAAAQGYANAPGVATPYNQMATSAINNAVGAGSGYNQNAMANYTGGLAASMPYTLGGAQAVNAAPVDAAAISQYLSPFLNDVYKTTLAGQSVQNAQQSSALQGTAAQAGAFGGDRAGIAQANMAYQQNLANSQTNANLLNTGFTNALAAAQNQQNVNLGAQQANRAAQASTGQNIYNQMSNTGQNIAGLGQQVYGQNLGASTALSGLGNQMFGQQTAAAQGVGNIGQQIYGQQIGAAQGLGNMGQQISNQNINAAQGIGNIGQQAFGQQTAAAAGQLAAGNQNYNQALGAAAGQANVGQQVYNQNAATAAGDLAVGNQNYAQAMGAAQGQGAIGQQIYNQGAQTAAGTLNVGNQNYNQAMGSAQGLGNMGQQISNQNINAAQGIGNIGQQQFGQQIAGAAGQLAAGSQGYNQAMGAAAGQANVGQQIYNQGAQTAAGTLNVGNQNYNQAMGSAQGLGNMGQQTYNQGAATAGGLLGVGNQDYAQLMGAAQGIGVMGNQAFNQGNLTANGLAGMGNQTFNQNIASAQGLAGVGNQFYNQQAQAAQAALATGQNEFTQGAAAATQQANIGNSLNSMGLNAATTLGSLGGAAQTSALQGGQAQIAAGTLDQAQLQKGIDALVAQQKQQQAFDYSQGSWLTNNLATIAGGLTPSTQTQTQQGGSFIARGGAIKPHARASGGLIPNAASEGGTVSMGRAGQGFADGGMPDPYMTNMYNILGSIYPNQNPAQPAGALAPSAPSGGFAPAPVGLPALANGAQYAGNPFAALLNTASQINPANYAPAKTAATPVATGYPSSVYDPTALLAPKATKEPWWKPPEAAKPAAATDATAATSAGTTPTFESNMTGNIDNPGSGHMPTLKEIMDMPGQVKSGLSLLGSAIMDMGSGNNNMLSGPGAIAQAAASMPTMGAGVLGPTMAQGLMPGFGDIVNPNANSMSGAIMGGGVPGVSATGTPGSTTTGPTGIMTDVPTVLDLTANTLSGAVPGAGPTTPSKEDAVDPGLGPDPGPGPGPDGQSGPGGEGPAGNGGGGGGGGGGGSSEGGGEHEGGSNAYRGGLIRPHRREGGPVRKHYATSGGVGIADSLYSNDPNSYGYIFGQGTSPASLDQNSYGSPAMNARMAERQQSALQQLAGVGSTLGGLKSGFGVIGDLLSAVGLERGGRVGRAGGGLVGRHGYALDGEVTDMAPGSYPADLNDPAERAKYLSVPDPEVIKAAMRLGNQAPAAVNPALGENQNAKNPLPGLPDSILRALLPGYSTAQTMTQMTPEKMFAAPAANSLAPGLVGGNANNGMVPTAPTDRGENAYARNSNGNNGLMPTAPTDRGENAYARNSNAGPPSVSPGIDEPLVAPPRGLLGGNGGANTATDAGITGGMGGVGNAGVTAEPVKPAGGVVPAKDSSWWSQIANVISPDTSSEAPKGSWIDRNKGLLDILSLVGGGLAGMTGKRSLMGLVAGGISGAGAASQAVQKGIADRAKTAAETTNIPYSSETNRMEAQGKLLETGLKAMGMVGAFFEPETDAVGNRTGNYIDKRDLSRHSAADMMRMMGGAGTMVDPRLASLTQPIPGAMTPGTTTAQGGGNYSNIQQPTSDYAPHVAKFAEQYGVPANVANWVGTHESGWRPDATGNGVSGVWQFKPETYQRYANPALAEGKLDPTHPAQSTDAAMRYLSDLYKQTGSWEKAVETYGTFSTGQGPQADALRRKGFANMMTGAPISGSAQGAPTLTPNAPIHELTVPQLMQRRAEISASTANPLVNQSVVQNHLNAIDAALKVKQPIYEADVGREQAAFESARNAHDQAVNTLSNVQAQRDAFVNPNTGQYNVTGGPVGARVKQAVSLLKQIGAPDDVVKQISGMDPNSAAVLEKLQTVLGSEIARAEMNGTVRQGEWQRFQQTTPGLDIPAQASVFMLDKILRPKAQTDIDAYNFVKNKKPENLEVRSALSDFRARNPWYNGNAISGNAGQPNALNTQPVKVQTLDDVGQLQPGTPFIIPNGPRKGQIGYAQ